MGLPAGKLVARNLAEHVNQPSQLVRLATNKKRVVGGHVGRITLRAEPVIVQASKHLRSTPIVPNTGALGPVDVRDGGNVLDQVILPRSLCAGKQIMAFQAVSLASFPIEPYNWLAIKD